MVDMGSGCFHLAELEAELLLRWASLVTFEVVLSIVGVDSGGLSARGA
jgi:hypothetical protein